MGLLRVQGAYKIVCDCESSGDDLRRENERKGTDGCYDGLDDGAVAATARAQLVAGNGPSAVEAAMAQKRLREPGQPVDNSMAVCATFL